MHHSERCFFTAYLDLLVLRFSVHCSSTTSLDILFQRHVYIFTYMYVAVAIRKTCRFVYTAYLLRCIDVLSDDAKNDFIRVRRLFKKRTRAL